MEELTDDIYDWNLSLEDVRVLEEAFGVKLPTDYILSLMDKEEFDCE